MSQGPSYPTPQAARESSPVAPPAPAADGASRRPRAPAGGEGRGLKRFRARWLALLGATLIALYLCWLMVQPFVGVLLWAMVLTIIFYPIRNYFIRRVRHPGWAAGLTCLFVVAVIGVPLALVATAVAAEATAIAGYVSANAPYLLGRDTTVFRFLSRYIVDLDRLGMREYLIKQLQGLSGGVASGESGGSGGLLSNFLPYFATRFLPGLLGSAMVRVLEVLFVILTMYYLFRDGDRVQSALLESLPLERAQSQRIFDRTREVIGASVYGVLVIAAIQAALGGLAFWVLGLPSPLLWAVVMFFLSMIPMAGSFVVWVPAAAFLALNGHWVRGVVLAGWCAGVVGMIDNVLRPRWVGRRTRLHELLIFFSVLGGLELFGMVGLVMGPVVAAITLALLDVFRKADRPAGAAPDEPTLIEQQAALRNVPEETGPAGVIEAPAGPAPVVEPEPPAMPAAAVTVAGPTLDSFSLSPVLRGSSDSLSPVLRGEGRGEGHGKNAEEGAS